MEWNTFNWIRLDRVGLGGLLFSRRCSMKYRLFPWLRFVIVIPSAIRVAFSCWSKCLTHGGSDVCIFVRFLPTRVHLVVLLESCWFKWIRMLVVFTQPRTKQGLEQPTPSSINPRNNRSIDRSTHRSANRPTDRPTNQSINQSINQSLHPILAGINCVRSSLK